MWTKVLSTLFVGLLFASCAVAGRPQPPIRRAGVLPVEPNCGAPHLDMRIINGYNTAIKAYPWMALLVYVDKKNGQVSLGGAGSLINNRYVVTAAHCVIKLNDESPELTRVRLGEYDTSRTVDCVRGDCNNPVVEVVIEEIVVHPKFNISLNDIALLRLAREVVFTDFISPVCLPLRSASVPLNTNDMLIVSGWGKTQTSDTSQIKQAVEVPVYDQNDCAQKYKSMESFKNYPITESQLCAGGTIPGDACRGDSGGPLMRLSLNSHYYLEGIVSFGNSCGLKDWPGVYTRVAYFIDWIQARVLA